MSIRARLFGLISIVNIILVISMVYVNFQSTQMNQIRDEQKILQEMVWALNKEDSVLTEYLISGFNTTLELYEEVSANADEAFVLARESIVILPTLSEDISRSLDAAYRLNDLMASRRSNLRRSSNEFWKTAEANYPYIGGISIFTIILEDTYRRGEYEEVYSAADRFITTLIILHETITSNADELNKQVHFIDSEIARISRQQTLVMNLGIGGSILVSIILSLLIIRSILRKVRLLIQDINVLSGGDLTVTVHSAGRDELSNLGSKLNEFIDNLRMALGTIQVGASENSRARNDLLRSVQDAAGSVEEGEKNVDSILSLTATLDESVQQSAEAADLIVERVDGFSEMIESQVSMVEESTAAMTEITASLSSMSRIVGTNRKAATTLGEASREGSEKIEETGMIIKRVSGHVNAIQEMADIIQGVADQTNLLAMNAAIEAAHAGEAGRGFAVVADEIRKLAETTSENSRIISENLRAIIDDINEAGDASGETISSFEVIDAEVKGVIDSLSEVASSIEELGEGGSQVMEAMTELQEYTSRVKDSSGDISQNIHSVRNSVSVASDVSRQVTTGSEEIRTGMSIIRLSSERTRDVSDQIKEISSNLDEAVSKFHTGNIDADDVKDENPEGITNTPVSEASAAIRQETKSAASAAADESIQDSGLSRATADSNRSAAEPAANRFRSSKAPDSNGPKSRPEDSDDVDRKPASTDVPPASDRTAEKTNVAASFDNEGPGPADYSLVDEKSIAPTDVAPPQLEPVESESFTLDVGEGVTLSEGDWNGREEITIVDEEGKPEGS